MKYEDGVNLFLIKSLAGIDLCGRTLDDLDEIKRQLDKRKYHIWISHPRWHMLDYENSLCVVDKNTTESMLFSRICGNERLLGSYHCKWGKNNHWIYVREYQCRFQIVDRPRRLMYAAKYLKRPFVFPNKLLQPIELTNHIIANNADGCISPSEICSKCIEEVAKLSVVFEQDYLADNNLFLKWKNADTKRRQEQTNNNKLQKQLKESQKRIVELEEKLNKWEEASKAIVTPSVKNIELD